jgi:hypothetical protein
MPMRLNTSSELKALANFLPLINLPLR